MDVLVDVGTTWPIETEELGFKQYRAWRLAWPKPLGNYHMKKDFVDCIFFLSSDIVFKETSSSLTTFSTDAFTSRKRSFRNSGGAEPRRARLQDTSS